MAPTRPTHDVLAWSRSIAGPGNARDTQHALATVPHIAGYRLGWHDERGRALAIRFGDTYTTVAPIPISVHTNRPAATRPSSTAHSRSCPLLRPDSSTVDQL